MEPEYGFTFPNKKENILARNNLINGLFSLSQTTKGLLELRSVKTRYMIESAVASNTPTVKRVKMVHSNSSATLLNLIVACTCSEKASANRDAPSNLVAIFFFFFFIFKRKNGQNKTKKKKAGKGKCSVIQKIYI